jgi:predicted transglutaminase-like cysteine proteinase
LIKKREIFSGAIINSFKKQLRALIAGIAFMMQIAVPVVAQADSLDMTLGSAAHSVFVSGAISNSGAPLGLLDRHETRSDDITPLSHWSALLRRFEAPLYSTVPASSGIAAWRAEIQRLKGLSRHEQLERINDFMNKVPYVDDQKRYGQNGYWDATPERFFSDGGDCKDYALVKYASLRALGFSLEQLRITVVMDMTKNILHAILIVKEPNAAYVLDNQSQDIEAAADVHRYQPIFAVNSKSWWKYSG